MALYRLYKNIRRAIAVHHQGTWWHLASSIVQSCSNSFYDEDRPTVSRLRARAVEGPTPAKKPLEDVVLTTLTVDTEVPSTVENRKCSGGEALMCPTRRPTSDLHANTARSW